MNRGFFKVILISYLLILGACGAKQEEPSVTGIDAKVDSSNTTLVGSGDTPADGTSALTVTITLLDAVGQPVASVTPQISVSGSNNTISSCSVSDAAGISTCTVTSVRAETKSVALSFPFVKAGFDVDFTAGAATRLCFGTQPSGAVAGVAFAQQPVVRIGDANCNVVSSTASVNLALTAGSGSLAGTTSVSAIDGVATFSGINIQSAGTGKVITASSSGLTSAISTSFEVVAGAPSQVVIVTQPGGGSAGAAWAQQPVVELRDSFGNRALQSSASVSATLVDSNHGPLSGTATVSAVQGVVTFAGLSLNKSGTGRVLRFNSGTLPAVDSSSFAITTAAASQLVFSQQPVGSAVGSSFATQPVVQIQDAFGNIVNSAAVVNVALVSGGATLSGTRNVVASSGVATYTNLSMTQAGEYRLLASSGSLTAAQSDLFTMTPGPVVAPGVVTLSGASVSADGSDEATVYVKVRDSFNNPLAGKSVSVTSSRGGIDTILAVLDTTNAQGEAEFLVRSATSGVATLTVIADGVTLRNNIEVVFYSVKPEVEFRALQAENSTSLGVIPGSNSTTLSLWRDLFALNPHPMSIFGFGFNGSNSGWCGNGATAVSSCANGGYRLLFDGANDYGIFASPIGAAANRTADLWVRPTTSNLPAKVILSDRDDTGKGVRLSTAADGSGRVELLVGSAKSYPEVIRDLSPTLYYRMEETSGNLVANSAGSLATAGTAAGTLTYGQASALNDGGRSINFNGSNAYFSMGNVAENTADFSVSAWFYPTTVSGTRAIVSKQSSNRSYRLEQTGNRVEFHLFNSAGTGFVVQSPVGSIAINTWYHVVGVRTAANQIRLYLNGVQVATPATFTGSLGTSTQALTIGRRLTANYFQGRIDEVVIFQNRALSDLEIASMYESGTTPVCYSSAALANDTWAHLAYSFDDTNNQMKLYRNGALECTRTGINISVSGSSHKFGVGAEVDGADAAISGSYFPGAISELRVYGSALSDAQVLSIKQMSDNEKYP